MAMDIYNQLEKARNSASSSRSSLQDPSRYSIDSKDDPALNELDPLHPHGHGNGNASIAYAHANGRRGSSLPPLFDRKGKLKDGRSRWRAAIERYIPLSRLEQTAPMQHISRASRRLRRPVLKSARCCPTKPGRIMSLAATIFALFLLLLTGSAGVYVVKKGTTDGQSPPWYPTPLGGKYATWEDSYKKASKMVRKMTLVEKVNITTGTGWQMGMCVGNTGPVSRLGFPSLCLQDGPLGIRYTERITATPAGITVGSTWNADLMYKRGVLLGTEARNKGINVLLGPSVGPLGRMPGGGRNWEGFGADPVLQGRAAAETIRGIQDQGVMATVKHYVGNEQEHFRKALEWPILNSISSNIDDRTLHELYAWPFADSVKAGVASVMCSYNQVNNSYACQNSKLLNGVLKDELGFQGFVVTDWIAQRSGVASALAGLDMSMPGDGYRMGDGRPYWGHHLTKAVLNGTVPLERINDMVTRIVAAWYQLKQDDQSLWSLPPPKGDGGPNFSSWIDEEDGPLHFGSNDKSQGKVNQLVDATKDRFSHRELARKIAAEGIVLLKNDHHFLPLDRDGGSTHDRLSSTTGKSSFSPRPYNIGVFGEDAREPREGINNCEDRGCNKGTLATGWGSGAVEFPYLVSPMSALKKHMHKQKVVVNTFPENQAPSKSNNSRMWYQDVCIVFVNADSGEGYIKSGGVSGDRPNLKLQKGGNGLIKDVAANCGTKMVENKLHKGPKSKYKRSPTIVVIHSVGPVLLESFIDNPDIRAVLLANLPGQESGNALVDVLLGDVNPSGRLPYTIAKREKDYGKHSHILTMPNAIIPQQNFSEGLMIDYRWFDSQNIEPRYPFGFGLSYTSFSLKDLHVRPVHEHRPSKLPTSRSADPVNPPKYDSNIPKPSEALFPSDIRKLKKYIYPYLPGKKQATIGEPQPIKNVEDHPLSEAGGGEGGNPSLWETVADVDVVVENDGQMKGAVVVQLYVKFPDNVHEDIDTNEGKGKKGGREKIKFPPKVLRGFQKVHTYTSNDPSFLNVLGMSSFNNVEKVKFKLTRRDLSYWSVRQQNWVMPDGSFEIQVGFSSRDLPLKEKLF